MQTSHGRYDHRGRHRYSVIIAFLLAAFVIGWFIGRLRQRRREQSGEE
jgi:hypothetical protein